jgi:hypothetical protein
MQQFIYSRKPLEHNQKEKSQMSKSRSHFFEQQEGRNNTNMLSTTGNFDLRGQKYSKYHHKTVVELMLPLS